MKLPVSLLAAASVSLVAMYGYGTLAPTDMTLLASSAVVTVLLMRPWRGVQILASGYFALRLLFATIVILHDSQPTWVSVRIGACVLLDMVVVILLFLPKSRDYYSSRTDI